MKKEYLINLNNLNNLRQFNGDIMYQIASDVNAKYENQVVDAKSMMGLMMISIHDITVSINSDDKKELETFKQICEKYEVKNG